MALQCRACGTEAFDTSTTYLYGADSAKLLLNLELISGTTLPNEPELPSHICACCVLELQQAVAFRDRCLQTQRELQPMQCPTTPDLISGPEESVDVKIECSVDALPDFIMETSFVEGEVGEDDVSSEELEGQAVEDASEYDPLKQQVELHPDYQLPVLPKRPRGRPRKYPPKPAPKEKKAVVSWKNLTKEEIAERRRQYQYCNDVCELCGRKFKYKSNFKIHMMTHTGDKQFTCEDCGKHFYTEHLKVKHHRVVHQGLKPYPCRYCERFFGTTGHRTKHERTHTNIRPYKCNECGKSFIASDKLKRHQLIHSGIRAFACTICNQTFQRNTHLKQHLRSKTHKAREDSLKGVVERKPRVSRFDGVMAAFVD